MQKKNIAFFLFLTLVIGCAIFYLIRFKASPTIKEKALSRYPFLEENQSSDYYQGAIDAMNHVEFNSESYFNGSYAQEKAWETAYSDGYAEGVNDAISAFDIDATKTVYYNDNRYIYHYKSNCPNLSTSLPVYHSTEGAAVKKTYTPCKKCVR